MKNYGRASIHEFLGDLIVYRNPVPLNPRLPLLELPADVGAVSQAIACALENRAR